MESLIDRHFTEKITDLETNKEDITLYPLENRIVFDMHEDTWIGLSNYDIEKCFYVFKPAVREWLNFYCSGWEIKIHNGPLAVPFFAELIFKNKQNLMHFKLKWL
jgi:hypothetical protein